MSRGRIEAYDIGSLSPQATGVPGEAHVFDRLSRTLQNVASAFEQREDKKAEIEAIHQLGEFDLEYSKMKTQLQNQYKDSPELYPQQIREKSLELKEKYKGEMKRRVSDRFDLASEQYLTRDISNAELWSARQDIANINNSIQESYNNVALKAEQDLTPESLNMLLNGTDEGTLTLPNQNKLASEFWDAGTISKQDKTTRAQIITTGMDARIAANAFQTYKDLNENKYDNILSAGDVLKYKAQAEKGMKAMATAEHFRSLTAASVEQANIIEALTREELTVGDLNRNIMWADLNKDKVDPITGESVITEDYLRFLRSARDFKLNQKNKSTITRAAENSTFNQAFDAKRAEYLATKGENARQSAKDVKLVIGMYADLLEAFNNDEIDQKTFNLKLLSLNNIQRGRLSEDPKVMSLNDALRRAGKAGFMGGREGNDVYTLGYNKINEYIKKECPDMSEEDKKLFREHALVEYTRRVSEMSEEQKKNKEMVVAETLYTSGNRKGVFDSLRIYKDREGNIIRPGQLVKLNKRGTMGRFLGINPETGNRMFVPAYDLNKELENNA